MTPTQTTETAKLQNTVFDLTQFDDVKLVKTVALPAPVTSVEEALAVVGNNSDALLKVINAGLSEHVKEQARAEKTGWKVEDEDGNLSDTEYTGKYAEGDVAKTVNGAILNFAKMLAMGAGGWDSLKGEDGRKKKAEFKAMAVQNFRANPAVLASLTGQTAPAVDSAGK